MMKQKLCFHNIMWSNKKVTFVIQPENPQDGCSEFRPVNVCVSSLQRGNNDSTQVLQNVCIFVIM